MGLLDMFRRKASGADVVPVVNPAADWAASDAWRDWEPPLTFVVGESRRQDALRGLAGPPRPGGWLVPVSVSLRREPGNRFDANAIEVLVGGELVGYIDRDAAEEMAPEMDRRRAPAVHGLPGLIRGGWPDAPSLGVLVWPERDLRALLSGVDWEFLIDEFECETWPPNSDEGIPRRPDTPTATGRNAHESDGVRPSSPRFPPLTEHYTDYVEDVKELKRQKRLDEAEQLLLALIEETEAESRANGIGVAPWYYEQLAIVRRKARNNGGELEVLERFAKQQHAPGAGPAKLMKRLEECRTRVRNE